MVRHFKQNYFNHLKIKYDGIVKCFKKPNLEIVAQIYCANTKIEFFKVFSRLSFVFLTKTYNRDTFANYLFIIIDGELKVKPSSIHP